MALTAIDFFDSFDHYATANLTSKWTTAGALATISAGNGRRSTNSLRVAGGSTSNITKSLPVARSTIAVGFGFRATTFANNTILLLRNSGTTHVDLRTQTDGRLNVTRNGTLLGTSTNSLSTGTYYHIEIKVVIHDSAGTVEVRVNETSTDWIALTGQDTRNGATTEVNEIWLGMPSIGATTDFDDLIVADDFVGDKHVKALFADGAGAHTDFTPSAGSNYQNVDEAAPDDDTTYNASATLNHIDTYTFQNAGAGEVITAVAPLLYAKKTDAGTRSIAPVFRIGSTDYVGSNFNPSDTSYTYNQQIYMNSPATASAWTATELNGAEAGVKVTA